MTIIKQAKLEIIFSRYDFLVGNYILEQNNKELGKYQPAIAIIFYN